ncbi:type II restriction endonuclease [Peptostreptococcus anaerobius]|uniref:Type II restriction endonuclease n=1 Tax=Peptostreptococcus porci TaxID=2652282 RepID=A0A6N7XDT3_9FIRM|nr:MspI family type II restriction endonuclease [Peptostreptococcus porci]MST61574.1 type II restriction endonuclease [Peptostreptococcus porci]
MKTQLLNSLYERYNINSYGFGAIHDKLGDVYEDYCKTILKSTTFLNDIQNGNVNTLETQVLSNILTTNGITNFTAIHTIEATTQIPHRSTGGNSKTDIIATVHMINGNSIVLPISCKQSTVPKVALAEFDVDTICREMRITNPRLKTLLLKHQVDCSAKNFSATEKNELVMLMQPIARDFVRWVLTGSPSINSHDVCIPTSIIKFKLKKPSDRYNININNGDFDYLSFETLTIEECINNIMYKSNGSIKPGGFGTGLSWTYATGSKGQKMQFKG